MKTPEIRTIWEQFISSDKYSKYFQNNEEIWYSNLAAVKQYIDENKKKPSKKDNKYMQQWMQHQIHNAKHRIKIMINDDIYNMFFLRYILHRQIYNHENEKAIELMLVKLLKLIEEELNISSYILEPEKMIELVVAMFDEATNERQQGIANFMAELQDLYGKKSWMIRSILKKERE